MLQFSTTAAKISGHQQSYAKKVPFAIYLFIYLRFSDLFSATTINTWSVDHEFRKYLNCTYIRTFTVKRTRDHLLIQSYWKAKIHIGELKFYRWIYFWLKKSKGNLPPSKTTRAVVVNNLSSMLLLRALQPGMKLLKTWAQLFKTNDVVS